MCYWTPVDRPIVLHMFSQSSNQGKSIQQTIHRGLICPDPWEPNSNVTSVLVAGPRFSVWWLVLMEGPSANQGHTIKKLHNAGALFVYVAHLWYKFLDASAIITFCTTNWHNVGLLGSWGSGSIASFVWLAIQPCYWFYYMLTEFEWIHTSLYFILHNHFIIESDGNCEAL